MASIVDDLHTEGLLVLVLVVIDVDQDLLLTHALTWSKAQPDGVHLLTSNLHTAQQAHGEGLGGITGPDEAPIGVGVYLKGVLLELQQIRPAGDQKVQPVCGVGIGVGDALVGALPTARRDGDLKGLQGTEQH